jgi:hypothetical protein
MDASATVKPTAAIKDLEFIVHPEPPELIKNRSDSQFDIF